VTAAGQLEAGQLEAGQLDAGQPGAIQSGAILAHLREATRPAHQALDVALGLMDDGIGIAAYTRLLERFYGFWCGWQPQMAGLMRDEALLGPRRRLHLLAADLAALGLSPDAVRALPWCPLPALRDASEALGSLYVMEGSTLGGRVILRHVGNRLGLDGNAGCAYFAGYGTATSPMWRSFLLRLDAADMLDAGRIAAGASATFRCLGEWLTRH